MLVVREGSPDAFDLTHVRWTLSHCTYCGEGSVPPSAHQGLGAVAVCFAWLTRAGGHAGVVGVEQAGNGRSRRSAYAAAAAG